MAMRSGLFLPLFGELADPAAVARLSLEAKQAGWHGVFVWDHVRWQPELAAADPWITLAAVATATERVRLGPMVTPLALIRAAAAAAAERGVSLLVALTAGVASRQAANDPGPLHREDRFTPLLNSALDIWARIPPA